MSESAAVAQKETIAPVQKLKMKRDVEFTGTGLGFIGTGILSFLVTTLSFGFCAPWGITMYFKWETENTIVDGKPLKFNGSAWGLFGTWIKWWALSVITLGIYGFWVYPDLRKWIANNTTIVK
jgi:uncharacterized membrane protein YjgN (DUF898 family)